jgi:hypothetical protein
LSIDSIPKIEEPVETKVVQSSETHPIPRTFRPSWELRLPSSFVVSVLDETEDRRCSLTLKLNSRPLTREKSSLLDSGATGMFIDRDYVKTNELTTRTLSHPIPVRNVDGTLNEAGSVHEVVELILRYKNHSEKAFFAVTSLRKQNVIMGHSWLQKHNPDIDRVTGDVKMSRCSGRCCSGCRDEIREECRTRKIEARRLSTCSEGDLPALIPDDEDNDEVDSEIEDGDRIFVTALEQPTENICATSTISQRLAEAFKRNSDLGLLLADGSVTSEGIPVHLREFSSVFSKESFDALPDPKPH